MHKTIRSKFYFANLLVILLAVSVTAVLLFTQLGGYLSEEKMDILERRASQLSETAALVFENQGPFSEHMFRRNLAMMSDDTSSTILILDREKNIIMSANEDLLDFSLDEMPSETFQKVLNGEKVTRTDRLSGVFSETVLYVMQPVLYNSKIMGAVMFCTPLPMITRARSDVMRIFLTAVLFACIASFVLSYFMARRISEPLKEISRAAKKIADGDFKQRVNVDCGDELGQLATSFNQMVISLEELDSMRSSFISSVSHELRTPMTIISGFVEGVLDGTIPQSEQQKYLSIVLSEMKRLSRLVNDLLEAARLESGGIKLNMAPFNINELLRKEILTYEHGITSKNIDVKLELAYEDSFVNADYDAIYRVVNNLLDNAVKFTPQDGTITLISKKGEGSAKIILENSGSGIKKEDLSHIWERFYKTDKSRSEDKKGVGLGLYIVKTIISAHNGNIFAESEEGKFTRFTFTLPLAKDTEKAKENNG